MRVQVKRFRPYVLGGALAPGEGLLFHVNIPVRGLSATEVFPTGRILGSISGVRVGKIEREG